MCSNKVLSLNFDKGNPNPSILLGNVQWKFVKQYRNSDSRLFSLMQPSLLTFLNFRDSSKNEFEMCNKGFSLNFDMGNPISSLFIGNFQ